MNVVGDPRALLFCSVLTSFTDVEAEVPETV